MTTHGGFREEGVGGRIRPYLENKAERQSNGNWASDERNKAGIKKKIFLRVSSKPQFDAWLPKKKSYRVPSTI